MNKNNNVWQSFRGCVIAIAPFVIATVTGRITANYLLTIFPPVVAYITAVNIFCLTWVLLYILKNKLGE